ncbi:MAG: hypothetical protein ACLQJR_06235 [Stellaceae bacterium]
MLENLTADHAKRIAALARAARRARNWSQDGPTERRSCRSPEEAPYMPEPAPERPDEMPVTEQTDAPKDYDMQRSG